jgi:hypothetical protein
MMKHARGDLALFLHEVPGFFQEGLIAQILKLIHTSLITWVLKSKFQARGSRVLNEATDEHEAG